jgi:thioredoxin reductase
VKSRSGSAAVTVQPLAAASATTRISRASRRLKSPFRRSVPARPGGTALVEAHEREVLVARGVRIVDGEVTRIASDENGVRGVELAGGPMVSRTALLVGPRFVPSDELLTALGCELNDEGWVATDRTGRTSVDGVWAPGTVADHTAQLINAAAAGSAAAIALNHYLVAPDVEQALNGHPRPVPAN